MIDTSIDVLIVTSKESMVSMVINKARIFIIMVKL